MFGVGGWAFRVVVVWLRFAVVFLGCVMLFCYGCLIGRFCLLFADVYGCALWLPCVGFDVIAWMVVGYGC